MDSTRNTIFLLFSHWTTFSCRSFSQKIIVYLNFYHISNCWFENRQRLWDIIVWSIFVVYMYILFIVWKIPKLNYTRPIFFVHSLIFKYSSILKIHYYNRILGNLWIFTTIQIFANIRILWLNSNFHQYTSIFECSLIKIFY